MTEIVSLIPPDHQIASVRRYEAGPPVGLELVEPGETIATTKEEEWISKKKTEVTNTKQIETRVKRQVVLEDGKVVEDSGPMVTTNTTEDTETQEHHQTELRKLGDDDVDGGARALEDVADVAGAVATPAPGPVAVPNPDGVVREVKERRVVSREETEEVKETEDVQHLGDITDEDFLAAVRSGKRDLRRVLRSNQEDGSARLVSTGPRLVRDSTKSKKVTDTEDTRELSSVRPDGRIVTETERTTEHEEVGDEELPEDAPGEEEDFVRKNSERYLKTREQEDVEYLSNGVNIGGEMRFKTETMEVERRGDGLNEPDLLDSLSARARRRNNNNNNNTSNNIRQQPHRYRGIENGVVVGATSLDRKDALTRKPLDFDQEEETRKAETSKWLEHHFGSDSRSSNNSLVDEDPEPETPKGFFNVTIKSQPTNHNAYVSTLNNNPSRVYGPVEPERDRNHVGGGYYKGIADWSERRHAPERQSPPTRHPIAYYVDDLHPSPRRQSPSPDYRPAHSPPPDYRPAYRHSPVPDYGRVVRTSPRREAVPVAPTPPQRKYRQRATEETSRSRYENGYRNVRLGDERDHIVEEPPPDYSPPSPPPMPPQEKKHSQKTRFAVAEVPTKPHKSGNIIGQSIRKLVGKIRSASAERKAKQQRSKRSPSPTYQQAQLIDSQISGSSMERPVQRYYLGEDPFGGSIYGRENKYDGVRPARASRRPREEPNEEERRSQSTLGRFSKQNGRPARRPDDRSSQTLPRHHQARRDDTINVSIINTVSEGPAKPARTYRSNLSRSKSLNAHEGPERRQMYTSNPQLNRLEDKPIGLKSPGLISSLNRSDHHQVHQHHVTPRFAGNGFGGRDPLEEEEETNWKVNSYSNNHHNNIYEPPTRLRDSKLLARRGSSSSTDYSETYRTTTRGDDPLRPSVTNTTKSFSKKTIPAKGGRSVETIQSSEVKSVTKSHYRGQSPITNFYDDRRNRYNHSPSPVVIEVRSYRK